MSERTPLAAPEQPRGGDYAAGGPVKRAGLRVEPPATGSRRRLPELILGVLLIAGCALAAVLLALTGRSRTPALALGNDVQRGDVIEESDLVTVQLGTDGDVTYLGEGERDSIVGRVALTDMGSGVVLSPEMVGEPLDLLAPGDGLVGLTLDIDQMPALDLAVGDAVNVVVRPQTSTGPGDLVGQAQVADIQEIEGEAGRDDRWYVSLRAPQTQADQIAAATVGDARVDLVMVGS